MFGKKEKPKPKPRCFERELDELVKEEIEQLGDKYNSIPLIVFLSIQVLEKQKFKEVAILLYLCLGYFQNIWKFNSCKNSTRKT